MAGESFSPKEGHRWASPYHPSACGFHGKSYSSHRLASGGVGRHPGPRYNNDHIHRDPRYRRDAFSEAVSAKSDRRVWWGGSVNAQLRGAAARSAGAAAPSVACAVTSIRLRPGARHLNPATDGLLEIADFVERKGLRADRQVLSDDPISLTSFRSFVRQQL